jgi:hypothetical protein
MIRLRIFPKADVKGWPDDDDAAPVGAQSWPAAEITSALAAEYATDAHTVGYEADDGPHGRQRLNGDALARGVHPRMVVHFVDVDSGAAHKSHGEADDDWRAAEAVKVAALQADVPGIVCYLTRGGYRLVGVLREPVVIDGDAAAAEWKVLVGRRLAWLSRRYGIVGDPACSEWQRLYRLPHATRPKGGGRPEGRPVVGDWSALAAWPDAIDEELPLDVAEVERLEWKVVADRLRPAPLRAPRPKLEKRTREARSPAIAADVGAITRATRDVAAALAQLPRGVYARHYAILAVVGALIDAGWADAPLRRVLDGIAALLGDAAAEITSALAATHRRRAAERPYYARSYLREHAKEVHEALAATLAEAPPERWRRVLERTAPPPLLTPDEAAARVLAALAATREGRGLTVLDVSTGAGKSYAAAADARLRADEGKRTLVLAPSHTVARELTALLAGWGVAAVHLTGVLSHRNDDGGPTCQHHAEGQRLAATRADVVDVLCEGRWYGDRPKAKRLLPVLGQLPLALPKPKAKPKAPHIPCAHLETCPARAAVAAQVDAMKSALVVVAVHQLAEAGHDWLLQQPDGALAVIDEAPTLFTAVRLTSAEIAAAAASVGADRGAVVRSERWRGPLLAALSAGLALAPTATRLTDVLTAGLAVTELNATDDERRKLIANWAARSASRDTFQGADDGGGKARVIYTPRPARRVLVGLRRGGVEQSALDAIALCGLVGRALAAEYGAAPLVRVGVGAREYGDGAGALELRLTALAAPLASLLSDVSIGRVLLDGTADVRVLNTLVPAPATVTRLAVIDAAPVERFFVPRSHATMWHCLLDGAPVWAELLEPLREGLAIAAEGLAHGSTIALFSWQAVTKALDGDELRPTLDELRARGITVVTGYFFNTRGRNDWRHADALLAVGTPWPNGAGVAQLCAAAGLDGMELDVGRYMARAELEQVVGRLRAPRRDKPGRIVVVGTQPPLRADARWQVRGFATGRPTAAPAAELAALVASVGRNEAARRMGVSPRTASRAVAAHTPGGGVGHNGLLSTPLTCFAPPPPPTPRGGLSTPDEADGCGEQGRAPYKPPPVGEPYEAPALLVDRAVDAADGNWLLDVFTRAGPTAARWRSAAG